MAYSRIFALKKYLLFLRIVIVALLLFPLNYANAQESMLPDVSYPFLERLIAAAKTNYPKTKAYQRKLREAELNLNKAKLAWFNALNVTYLYSPGNSTTLVNPATSSTTSGGFQFGFFLNLGTLLTNGPNVKAAREEMKVAELDQQEYALNIEATVKTRYFTYVQQMSLLNWKIKDMQNSESTVKDLKYKFEKGEETFENYNKSLAFYSNLVQSKIQAEAAMLIAKSNLEEIVGVKIETLK